MMENKDINDLIKEDLAIKEGTETEHVSQFDESLFNEGDEVKEEKQRKSEGYKPEYITGKFIIQMVDRAMQGMLPPLSKKLGGSKTKADIKLNATEKKDLIDCTDDYLATLEAIKMSPFGALFLTITTIYAAKIGDDIFNYGMTKIFDKNKEKSKTETDKKTTRGRPVKNRRDQDGEYTEYTIPDDFADMSEDQQNEHITKQRNNNHL